MAAAVLALNRNPKYEMWRSKVFLATWLGYFGLYLTRKSFSVAKVELMKPGSMHWSKGQLATVDLAYLITYALGNFACGAISDRFGTRKVILTGILVSVIIALLMGSTSLLLAFGIFWGIQGICQSTGWGPLTKNVGEFFSLKERGRVLGFWCTSYALGGYLGSYWAGVLAKAYGWRYSFWVPAGGLLIIWIIIYAFQRNRPEDIGLPPIEQYHGEEESLISDEDSSPDEEKEGSWDTVRAVLKNKMVLLLSFVYFLLKPTRYLVLFWSPVYIEKQLSQGMAVAGNISGMFDLAGPIAVILGGYISDKMFRSKRMPLSIVSLILCAIVMFFFFYLPKTQLSLGLGFFAVGFLLTIPDSLVSGAAAIDFGTKKGAGTASGFVNGTGSLGAIFGGTIPGWIENFLGKGADIWHPIFVSLSIGLLLAAILLMPQWNVLPPTAKSSA